VKFLDTWKKKISKLKLSCIGKMVAGEGVLLRDKMGSHKLNAQGYEHFQKGNGHEH
jgi:thiamine monophosphate kinase